MTVEWNNLAQGRGKWRIAVKAAMSRQVAYCVGNISSV